MTYGSTGGAITREWSSTPPREIRRLQVKDYTILLSAHASCPKLVRNDGSNYDLYRTWDLLSLTLHM